MGGFKAGPLRSSSHRRRMVNSCESRLSAVDVNPKGHATSSSIHQLDCFAMAGHMHVWLWTGSRLSTHEVSTHEHLEALGHCMSISALGYPFEEQQQNRGNRQQCRHCTHVSRAAGHTHLETNPHKRINFQPMTRRAIKSYMCEISLYGQTPASHVFYQSMLALQLWSMQAGSWPRIRTSSGVANTTGSLW